jgi:hypothetical protein
MRVDKMGESSYTLLSPLKYDNPHNKNIQIGFFRVPSNNHLFSIDQESGLGELLGVHHIKYYVFDNDVILTG